MRKLSWLDRITFRALAGSLVFVGATSMSDPPVPKGADLCIEIGGISSCFDAFQDNNPAQTG